MMRMSMVVFGVCSVWVTALNCGQSPCLPGLDGVGVGFDAVKGLKGLRIVNFTYAAGGTYTDPFGNRTVYAVPDQATVTTGSTQFMGHYVLRSASQWVSTQANWAGLDASFGPWFSASAQTSDVAKTMSDGMHSVIESRSKLTLYQASINPPALLRADSGFQATVDALPADYDADAYAQVVMYYGTHYVRAAEFGGLAQMRTVATQSFHSTTTDQDMQAQASIQWGLFGGGGGGGSSQKDTSQAWKDGTVSTTNTQGGDPAIPVFYSTDAWTSWAKSVETSAPMQTQFWLQDIASMVNDTGKAANLRRAILDYAAAHNTTWPAADPVDYILGWCDCEVVQASFLPNGAGYMPSCAGSDNKVIQHNCPEGKVMTSFEVHTFKGFEYTLECRQEQYSGSKCCRPCFKVSQTSSSTAIVDESVSV